MDARKPRFSLRTRLMAAFAFVAIAPALLVLGLQLENSERLLTRTSQEMAVQEHAAIRDVGEALTRVARATIEDTNDRLIALSEAELGRLNRSVGELGRRQLRQTSERIIDVGRATNQALTADLIALDRKALADLTADLKRLNAAATRELAGTTADRATRLVRAHTRSLIAYNEALSRDLGAYVESASRETASQVSQGLKAELRREPLVNFRVLAQIMAQAFAGARETNKRGAHVTLVNRSGEVVASTRYQRGEELESLEIVYRALHDPPAIAAQRPLVAYEDAGVRFIGVYDRRPTGGAVIVGYQLALAEADVRQVEALVDASLTDLATTTSQGASRAIAGTIPRIHAQADDLTRNAREALQATAARIGTEAEAQMTSQAQRAARTTEARMAAQSLALQRASAARMRTASRHTLEQAVGAAAALGERSEARARAGMNQRARAATEAVSRQIQPQIERIGQQAAARIPARVAAAMAATRRQAFAVAAALLLAALGLGAAASWWLSSRIADPIELEERLKQAELDRVGQELAIAARIQTALLPRDLEAPGFTLAIALDAATEVGGDLIDFVPRPDGRFWLAIGDVTGHGLTPGLVMMMAQSLLTGFVGEQPEAAPRDVLARINRGLYGNIRYRLENDNFMTLQLLRHEGGGRFVAAGLHTDILIHRRATGAVERVHVEGTWIGLMPEVSDLIDDVHFALGPGDTLLLYTDGVIEAAGPDGRPYDLARLERRLAAGAAAALAPAALTAFVLDDVRAHMRAQADDMSLVVMRREEVPNA